MILHISNLRGRIQDGYPPVQMLNHMFKPVPDTSDPTDDGLGMNLNDMVRNANYSWYWGSLADEEYWTRWRYWRQISAKSRRPADLRGTRARAARRRFTSVTVSPLAERTALGRDGWAKALRNYMKSLPQ